MKLIGPFTQILTMDSNPLCGPIEDYDLKILEEGAIVIQGDQIVEIGRFQDLAKNTYEHITIDCPSVAIPGMIDAHTHLCFAGSREKDYALRVSGMSYLEIASRGGGILDTVSKTRTASPGELFETLAERLDAQLRQGVTTCEIKSGYGLSLQDEIKMLRVIQRAKENLPVDIIATCLAAHVVPQEFESESKYLQEIIDQLLPRIKKEKLTNRVDIFVEKGAFSTKGADHFLKQAKSLEFDCTVHANQFTGGGAEIAAKWGAKSADHLENINEDEIHLLKVNNVAAVVLPGASLGLGLPFAQAKLMLRQGLSVAIASDWNPGSAPMGKLLTQAAVMGAFEKLTLAETFAGLTFRAARALGLHDRGVLRKGMRADAAIFPCSNYREILYYQGSMLPSRMIIRGKFLEVEQKVARLLGKSEGSWKK